MPDTKRMLLAILAVAVIGALHLGYNALAFHNGVDLAKDTGGTALVAGATALLMKLMGSGNNGPQP